jgi:hypothetical protein
MDIVQRHNSCANEVYEDLKYVKYIMEGAK